jgi:tripartite-type tricarboxylate transporter receptor subunit TctC
MNMQGPRRRHISTALACAIVGCSALGSVEQASAQAQSFPSREVTLVVPFGTGGSNDIFARALGSDLSKLWNRPVLIENRPGSGGAVGAGHVTRSAPDGHVLLFTSSAFVINAVLQKNLPFDPILGFSPIALVGSGPMMLVARPNLGVKNATELIALARSRPEGITFASVGVGSATHMALELFSSMAQAKFVHVPYKGGAQAITDLIAGHVDLYAGSVPQVLQHVRSGRALPIGVTSQQRSSVAPDVPSLSDALKGYDVDIWWAVIGPGNMPAGLVGAINADIRKVLATPRMQEFLAKEAALPANDPPAKLAELIQRDIARWKIVAERADIPAQ